MLRRNETLEGWTGSGNNAGERRRRGSNKGRRRTGRWRACALFSVLSIPQPDRRLVVRAGRPDHPPCKGLATRGNAHGLLVVFRVVAHTRPRAARCQRGGGAAVDASKDVDEWPGVLGQGACARGGGADRGRGRAGRGGAGRPWESFGPGRPLGKGTAKGASGGDEGSGAATKALCWPTSVLASKCCCAANRPGA